MGQVDKRLRIMYDYDKRQKAVEEDAVRRVVESTRRIGFGDGPMVPDVAEARYRIACGSCGNACWVKFGWSFCEACAELNVAENKLNLELHRAQRELRMLQAKRKLRQVHEYIESGEEPPDELLFDNGWEG